MRRFMMLRRSDATGISGVGHVADGVEFDDGSVAIRWRTAVRSSGTYASIADAKAIHGHGGETVFEFHDDPTPILWLCCMCFADMDPPVNHCFQCGSGGSAIAMSKSQLDMVQRHDKQRLESLEKCHRELRALRSVAIDHFGPTALGLSVQRFTGHDGEEFVSLAGPGGVTYSVRPEPGEHDTAFLRRAGENASLDPEQVRRLRSERAT